MIKLMIGERIKAAREEKGISQRELARRLNVANGTVSSWESNRTEPDIDMLNRIASLLDVTSHELISGKAPQTGWVPPTQYDSEIIRLQNTQRILDWWGLKKEDQDVLIEALGSDDMDRILKIYKMMKEA